MAKKKTTKAKMGRPKEKPSDKVDLRQVALLCEWGKTDKELAGFFGVSRATISNWKKDKDFLRHLKQGKAIADENVVRSLYERAMGYSHPEDKIFNANGEPLIVPTIKHYPPDTAAMIWWLKNRKPEEWRDKITNVHEGEIGIRNISDLIAKINSNGRPDYARTRITADTGALN